MVDTVLQFKVLEDLLGIKKHITNLRLSLGNKSFLLAPLTLTLSCSLTSSPYQYETTSDL